MSAEAFDFWLGRWKVVWGEDSRGTNSDDELWRQTWVDSQGSYLRFEGNAHDGVMELRGEHRGEPRRMVWRDVERGSLTWLWQRSADGGSSWETLWELAYSRLE